MATPLKRATQERSGAASNDWCAQAQPWSPVTGQRPVGAEKEGAVLRESGLAVVGPVPWGMHFCQFYHTRQDLEDVLVPYFEAGLRSNEFCMWITSAPLEVEEAVAALGKRVGDLESRVRNGQIEILSYAQWYQVDGRFDRERVLRGWLEKERKALSRGFAGLRLSGNTFWLAASDWKDFSEYEASINGMVAGHKILALCTYATSQCGALEVIDVVRHHEFALIKQDGVWQVIESLKHKETEEALRRSQQTALKQLAEIEAIYNSAQIGLCVLDRDLRFVRINRRLAELNGLSVEAHRGKTVRDVVPDLAPLAEELAARIFQTGEAAFNVEFSCSTPANPDRKRHWIEQWLPLKDTSGMVVGINVVVQDVTEGKEAEDRLQQLNQKLESLLVERTMLADLRAKQLRVLAAELAQAEQRERGRSAMVLHDHLQPLLIAARLRLSVLETKNDPAAWPPVVAETQDLLTKAIDTTRSLSVQLNPPVLMRLGLAPALQWLKGWMKNKHGLKVELRLELAAEPTDETARMLCFQGVRELLLNVVKHAEVNTARVTLKRVNNMLAQLSVSDSGRGFDPELVEQGSADVAEGQTGFGLWNIAQRLALIGGHFQVESRVGGGTTAHLLIPLKPAEKPEGAAMVEPGGRFKPRVAVAGKRSVFKRNLPIRVLLADDHQILRECLAGLLRTQPDFEVVGEAGDGEAAIDLARKYRPDVVVMDVGLPKINGIEATRRICRELPGVHVIGLSMHEETQIASAMRQAGATAYLTKAAPSQLLVQSIRQSLSVPGHRRAPVRRRGK